MGWLDFLFPFDSGPPLDIDQDEIERQSERLARGATGSTVTPERLANHEGDTKYPVVSYLDEGEQPEFLFRGGPLMISDEDGEVGREFPSRKLNVVVTDRRILFLLGKRRTDELWGVDHEDVRDVTVDRESWQCYLIVDAVKDETPITFYADTTIEADKESLVRCASFLETRVGSEE